ncbi:MAG: hypothetical protein NVS2B16_27320 [Chloroflexota bacterium]
MKSHRHPALCALITALAISAGSAWTVTTHAAFSGHARADKRLATARISYVALGDAFTSGGSCSGVASSLAYPGLLSRRLPRGARYHNVAEPSAVTIGTGLVSQLPAALDAHPTVVTAWFGLTDASANGSPTSPTSFRADLDTLLTTFQRARTRVFIANVPDLRYFHDPDTRIQAKVGREYNAIIAAQARRHGAVVVDMYAISRAIWGRPGMVVADCFDLPSIQGQRMLANLFYRSMHRHGAL